MTLLPCDGHKHMTYGSFGNVEFSQALKGNGLDYKTILFLPLDI